jgi:Glucan phosphorylase
MKTPPNGGLNLSVLDGWWGEGFNGNNGWAIGAEIKGGSVEFQSEVDAASLYQLLENQIIPLYYAKPDGKLPLAWLQLMRESIRSVTPGSIPIAWSRNTPSGFMFRRRRLIASFCKTIAQQPAT